ncbi:MAG: hypothetical protein ABWY78_18380 [Microvirga sp.]
MRKPPRLERHRPTFDIATVVPVLHKGSCPVLEQIVHLATSLVEAVLHHGDLAHFVLLLWAIGASALLAAIIRDVLASNRRLHAFVRKLALIMSRRGGGPLS